MLLPQINIENSKRNDIESIRKNVYSVCFLFIFLSSLHHILDIHFILKAFIDDIFNQQSHNTKKFSFKYEN